VYVAHVIWRKTIHSGRFAMFVRSVFICVYCVVFAWISGRFAVFIRSVFIAWRVRGPCHFGARLFISGRFAVFVRSVLIAQPPFKTC